MEENDIYNQTLEPFGPDEEMYKFLISPGNFSRNYTLKVVDCMNENYIYLKNNASFNFSISYMIGTP